MTYWLMMLGYKEHQEQDYDWNKCETTIIKDFAGGLGFAFLPVAEFGAIFHTDLVRMGEVMGEFMGFGVAVSGVALEGPVDDFLQLG